MKQKRKWGLRLPPRNRDEVYSIDELEYLFPKERMIGENIDNINRGARTNYLIDEDDIKRANKRG